MMYENELIVIDRSNSRTSSDFRQIKTKKCSTDVYVLRFYPIFNRLYFCVEERELGL
ncbi:hypothetical protein MKX03_020018, partial [Papaver bracteatum]